MSAPLRVAVLARRVHPAHGPGGLERHVHDQVVELVRAGVAVDLIVETPDDPERRRRAEAELPTSIRWHWVARGRLPLGRRPGTVVLDRITNYPAWSRRAARCIDPACDVIHAHGLAGLGVAEMRARGRLPQPLVFTTHGMEEFLAPPLKRLAYLPFRRAIRRIAALADAVVITDEVMLPVAEQALGLPAERLTVIPNAVDPDACTGAADGAAAAALLRQRFAGPPQPLLVSVGRLAANKGFDVLAAALGRAAPRLPPGWGWVLVGDGPERAAITAAVAAAGIADRVFLPGAVDDTTKHGLLGLADWFVHPTLYEGSSLVTLEAMAHSLPVLASRAGGLPDKVIDGTTGLLVPPGDAGELAAALARLAGLDGPSLGRAGRQLLDDRFALRAVTVRLVALYRQLMTGRSGPDAVR